MNHFAHTKTCALDYLRDVPKCLKNHTYHSLLHQTSGAQNNSLCMFEKADEQGFTVFDFLCLLSFSLPLVIL